MDDVQFDSEEFAFSRNANPVRKGDWADTLVAKGIVRTRSTAQALLIGVVIVCFAGAVLIATAEGTPEVPKHIPPDVWPPRH